LFDVSIIYNYKNGKEAAAEFYRCRNGSVDAGGCKENDIVIRKVRRGKYGSDHDAEGVTN